MDVNSTGPEKIRSPLAPAALVSLLLRPKEFFTNLASLTKQPEARIVAWVGGIAYLIGKIETNQLKAELIKPPTGWQSLWPLLSESWIYYWGFILVFGVLSGWFLWYVGGWWYRLRLKWSGDTQAEIGRVRATYVYQAFIGSGPVLLLALIQTAVFPNYTEAWNADEYWSMLTGVFLFWSIFVSYRAARTFEVIQWKARAWFLVLPGLLVIAAGGIIGTMYAYMDP